VARHGEYYNKLRILPGDLLEALRSDYTGNKEWFSAEAYKTSEFHDVVLGSLARSKAEFYIPSAIASFVQGLLGSGKVLSLYAGLGEFLYQSGGGIGVERVPLAAEWAQFLLDIAEIDARVFNEDPLKWESKETFERVICTPPFGGNDEFTAIEKGLSLLEEKGRLVVIVSPNFLWGAKQSHAREKLLERAHVSAIVSLPTGTFAHTAVQSSVLVLQRGKTGKSYMASSKSAADLGAIAADYQAWHKGKRFSIGFERDLGAERWDVAYNEPIEFGLGNPTFGYRVVSLGEVADIEAGKSSEKAKIAVNRTGSKAVWIADEPGIIPKNNIFVSPRKDINPAYLHLYLNSAVGRRAIDRLIKGAYIPHLSPKDLFTLPVVLPDLAYQSTIVADALALTKTIASLEALTSEGRQALKENLFGLETAKAKFETFSASTEEAFYQQLPFPIAVVYRKIANAPNNTQKFSLLIELFEVAIHFIVLVYLADSGSRNRPELLEKIPEIKKLYAPSLGDWVSIFRYLTRTTSAVEGKPFLAEIENFSLDKYQRTLQEFVDVRNASLRGHGATLTEDDYELRFQEHAPKVYDLISSLGFLANYTLVKTGQMEKDRDFYKIAVQKLMGDNPHFEATHVVLRTPLDTNKVMYLNRDLEPLVLDPYIVLERCPECHRPEVLLFDKLSDKKITYLSYESGHKPALANADRLPPSIRDLAVRRNEIMK
jgi:hypothetical protein